ncbi:MAG: response regulator [Gloeobacteraceae cyanobacterium ES-bin-316]|nr:response regulator [Ferruginibacter sp.]
MKPILNCILLIDDDEPTNFMSNMVLEEANCTRHIQIEESGQKALAFLCNTKDSSQQKSLVQYPELIFLDINMPAMNGWEFLEKFMELKKDAHPETIIIMLTTSINPDDKIRAEKLSVVAGFENKPLTDNMIEKLLQRHFNNQ